eukprot:CAMPEP_0114536602 /NCGR_PEP_ID=MMETSP0109-20121206/29104_1 /TAXON_ID=29199 /ORGANISM="Chlorarachnion reptans, Strain CCCM449" /LENGTH=132 /DNA_ID=CAMNT_0001720379 /DNA_START=225 /DNA_END=623 /DNA_ORIENTATION=+
MGTSLQVHPFAGLMNEVEKDVVRVLFNREPAGVAELPAGISEEKFKQLKKEAETGNQQAMIFVQLLAQHMSGFKFNSEDNKRDLFVQGDCDPCIEAFVKELGWEEDFKKIITEVRDEFKNRQNSQETKEASS